MALHQPVPRKYLHVRAPYQREVEKAHRPPCAAGSQRIGIVHVDDAFGQDGLAGAQKGLQNNKLPALFVEKFDRAKPDFSAIAPRVPCAGSPGRHLHRHRRGGRGRHQGTARGRRGRADRGTLSNNASGGFTKALGDQARA